MSKENYKNYFNGGCLTCMFAERDERGRYIGSCSGFSNCSYEEYKGETDITEEEKDKKIAELQQQLELTEKALELACERVKYFEQMQDIEMGVVEFFGQEIDYDLQSIIEQYKKQAKEIGNEQI